ncbi:MAG: hypothetical protein WA215_09855 [Candidatus Cybelea sp.]
MINFDHPIDGVGIYSACPSFNATVPPSPLQQILVLDGHARTVASRPFSPSIGPTAFRVDTGQFGPVVHSYCAVPVEINVESCDQLLAPFGSLETVWCTAQKAADKKSAWSPTMLFLLDLPEYVALGSESPASDAAVFVMAEFPEYLWQFGLAPAPRSKPFPLHDLTDDQYEKGKATATHLPRLESSVVYTKSKRD